MESKRKLIKSVNYVIDDLSVGRKSLVEDLGFEEKENFFFQKGSSFYRRYTLELGSEVCILKLDLKDEIKINQLKSNNPLFYTQVLELLDDQGSNLIVNHQNGFVPAELILTEKKQLRCL